ncbi:succinate dehydrogenase [Rubricoccus marinus]|uniref:Succinate dehydrogenase n=1 Tax=Rubricoccus marinus TaxID=716817 RepID=A0A259U2N5_9BACT|nr:succinate dehydrogenase [Rubricoccus marinus]OZC04064.1 succinate dehydrogenase [Rubricoccus marinus]
MASKYGATARSSAFQWFLHRITGTFLVFLLITHFWVQHYDRTTASISHSVVTAEEAEAGIGPLYTDEAAAAVRAFKEREGTATPEAPRTVPAQSERFGEREGDAPGPTHPPGENASVTSYDVLMLRLADPVYAGLWKAFNLLFLAFALHHGFYGLNNVITDYVRNDMLRVGLAALSWTVALVLFLIGAYSVIVAGL